MAGARAFGLAHQVDRAMFERMEKASGETHHQPPVPAVYLIGTDGVVDFSVCESEFRIRLDPDISLSAAKASVKEE